MGLRNVRMYSACIIYYSVVWTKFLNLLRLNYLIYKMKMIVHKIMLRINGINMYETLLNFKYPSCTIKYCTSSKTVCKYYMSNENRLTNFWQFLLDVYATHKDLLILYFKVDFEIFSLRVLLKIASMDGSPSASASIILGWG